MFKKNQDLIIKYKNKIIYKTTNTQSLYLYPLSLKDYIVNLKELLPIKVDIIKVDNSIDYIKYFNNKYFNNLLCAEIHIESKEDIKSIKELISLFKRKKISLTIKDIVSLPISFLKEISKDIDYFKIYWNYKDIDIFNKRLDIINKSRKKDSLVHIKSYLDLKEINNYEEYIKVFNKYNIDIYQLSKELQPLDKVNIQIDSKYEKEIRRLEIKYSNFKSVKNLKELYYPRFELDERNSRNCIACHLKPYLFNDILLPCKVDKMIKNMDEWGVKDLNNLDKLNRCGIECDDCASIYENDILNEILKIIENKENIEVYLEVNDKK